MPREMACSIELDIDGLARGLGQYVRLVSAALGLSGDSYCVLLDPPLTAYLALDRRLAAFPERDAALVWDEKQGWAMAVEAGCGEDLILLSYLGQDVLPEPRVVAEFTRRTFEEGTFEQSEMPDLGVGEGDDVRARLTSYASLQARANWS